MPASSFMTQLGLGSLGPGALALRRQERRLAAQRDGPILPQPRSAAASRKVRGSGKTIDSLAVVSVSIAMS